MQQSKRSYKMYFQLFVIYISNQSIACISKLNTSTLYGLYIIWHLNDKEIISSLPVCYCNEIQQLLSTWWVLDLWMLRWYSKLRLLPLNLAFLSPYFCYSLAIQVNFLLADLFQWSRIKQLASNTEGNISMFVVFSSRYRNHY